MSKTLARADDLAELQRRLQSVEATDARLWGTMSAGEAICHIREAYLAVLSSRQLTMAPPPIPRPIIKWLALRAPMKWPPGIKTADELVAGQQGMIPTTFEADRAEALAAMERFSHTEHKVPHAIFGTMCQRDWLRWGYLHTDHHLRQFGR